MKHAPINPLQERERFLNLDRYEGCICKGGCNHAGVYPIDFDYKGNYCTKFGCPLVHGMIADIQKRKFGYVEKEVHKEKTVSKKKPFKRKFTRKKS